MVFGFRTDKCSVQVKIQVFLEACFFPEDTVPDGEGMIRIAMLVFKLQFKQDSRLSHVCLSVMAACTGDMHAHFTACIASQNRA